MSVNKYMKSLALIISLLCGFLTTTASLASLKFNINENAGVISCHFKSVRYTCTSTGADSIACFKHGIKAGGWSSPRRANQTYTKKDGRYEDLNAVLVSCYPDKNYKDKIKPTGHICVANTDHHHTKTITITVKDRNSILFDGQNPNSLDDHDSCKNKRN